MLEAIFEHAPVGICSKDREGRILNTNRRLRDMLGYSEEEISRLTGFDTMSPADRPVLRGMLDALFSGRRDRARAEARLDRKSGDGICARFHATIVRPS